MIPVDFIDTAEKLLITDAPTEADIRSAISRSYYAVFHHTLLWWKSNAPFPNYKDRAHVKVQMALFNAGIPAAKDFSKDLRLLSNDRRKADYELTLKYDLANGQTTLDRARLAIAAFDALDKPPSPMGLRITFAKQTSSDFQVR